MGERVKEKWVEEGDVNCKLFRRLLLRGGGGILFTSWMISFARCFLMWG